jgi:pilus assembly protein CpaC
MALNRSLRTRACICAALLLATLFTRAVLAQESGRVPDIRPPQSASVPPVVQKITAINTKVDLTVNGSRILSMGSPIPKATVSNPELLAFTVLSESQVQIHAKKAGITTVNLWDDQDEIHTVDVVITGDVRELDGLIKSQFPTASVKLYPTQASTLVLSGYVDRPDYVNTIIKIAEDFYPKVINNMVVGGTQQVLLHVKVMEVSRTSLKELGFDFAAFSDNGFVTSTAAGVLAKAPLWAVAPTIATSGAETVTFGVIGDSGSFLGFLDALKKVDLAKVLAEPNLVTVSGRPASYLVGGEMPYPQPTGFGNISVNFKPFGTQIDFVPIVLGNGGVRLEVRPQVSELDPTIGITIAGTIVPGFRERFVDTGVEMKFGQTLAIAGLLQRREESERRGIPYLMDMPYIGAAFRRTRSKINEVELVILVRPELVEAMDPEQVPSCLPGNASMAPDDCGLYWKGYFETPVQMPGGGTMQGSDGQPTPAPAVEEVVPPAPQPAPAPSAKAPRRSREVVVSDRPAYEQPAPAARRNPPPQVARSQPHNSTNPQARKSSQPANANSAPPGFIGPIGYDVKK